MREDIAFVFLGGVWGIGERIGMGMMIDWFLDGLDVARDCRYRYFVAAL
jgi:hypothetical protein